MLAGGLSGSPGCCWVDPWDRRVAGGWTFGFAGQEYQGNLVVHLGNHMGNVRIRCPVSRSGLTYRVCVFLVDNEHARERPAATRDLNVAAKPVKSIPASPPPDPSMQATTARSPRRAPHNSRRRPKRQTEGAGQGLASAPGQLFKGVSPCPSLQTSSPAPLCCQLHIMAPNMVHRQ